MLCITDPKTWSEVISREMSPLAVRALDPSRFHAQLLSRSISSMKVLHINGASQEFCRSRRQAENEALRYFSVALHLNGHSELRHNGREATFGPGDVAVVDWTKAHARRFDDHFEVVTLLIPQHLLPRYALRLSREAGRRVGSDSAAGSLISALIGSLAFSMHRLNAHTGITALHSILDLVSSALLDEPSRLLHTSEPADSDDLFHRARQYVRAGLDDPDLSPVTIADAHHVSVRTLHLAFHRRGTTVQTTIREERLRMASKELASSDLSDTSMASLGRRCGFAGASQFSRVFRAEMRVSPSEYRRAIRAAAAVKSEPPS